MPVRRRPLNWRSLPPEAVAQLGVALDQFTEEAGRSRRELAQALELNASDLSPSHLQNRAMLAHWALRRDELLPLALRLRLDLHGYRALERLSVALAEVIGGYPIAADAWRDTPREALEIGAAGIALFDEHAWPTALTHLWHAWGVLAAPACPRDERRLPITLRVGAQLVDWLGYGGENRRAMGIVQQLLKLGREYRGREKPVLNSLALAYKAASVAAHHNALTPPEAAFRLATRAHALLAENHLDLPSQVGTLRDQAKPLLRWGFGSQTTPADPVKFTDAFGALDAAEARAGGEQPREGMEHEWLLTRLTRVQCLGMVGEPEKARHCFEATLAHPVVDTRCNLSSEGPLGSKLRFAALAVKAAAGAFDDLASAARAFREDPAHQDFADRVTRAGEIEQGAMQGDLPAVRQALVR